MAGDLAKAINEFPIVRWLEEHARVYDSGAKNVYTSCPVCGAKKKLGVSRQKKTAQCFKCNEGGAGRGIWKGTAGLIDLIRLFEKCTKSAAIERIFQLSGVQDYGYTPKAIPTRKLPRGAIPLSTCNADHPAVQMLSRRHCVHLIEHAHVCVSGRESHRVLMPIQWFGELAGYDAKSYLPAVTTKSLFAEWMDLAHTFHSTFAWDFSHDFAVITESVLDAETIGSNALGMNGSMLREGQLPKLLELRDQGVSRLVWFLDNDAWKKQANAILRYTSEFFHNYVVELSDDRDPNDLGREECWRRVKDATYVRDALDLMRLTLKRSG